METRQVRDTKFGTNLFNEKLLNAAKCYRATAFPVSELLWEKQQGLGDEGECTVKTIQIRVKKQVGKNMFK